MEVIGLGKQNKVLVEVNKQDLKTITDSDKDFEVGDIIEISNSLTILNQIKKKKDKYTALFAELSSLFNQV